ncbi:hypothetical protein WG66_000499, partial [Moniliophthora roreri]
MLNILARFVEDQFRMRHFTAFTPIFIGDWVGFMEACDTFILLNTVAVEL